MVAVLGRAERQALDRAESLRAEAEALLAEVRRRRSELDDVTSLRADLERAHADLATALLAAGSLEAELAGVRGDLDAASSEIDVLHADRDRLTSEVEALAAQLAEVRARPPVEPDTSVVTQLEDDLAVARMDLDRARADLNTARDERDRARAEIVAAREEARAARAERDRIRAEHKAAPEPAPLAPEDVLALVALVESVEAERDALAAELAALRPSH